LEKKNLSEERRRSTGLKRGPLEEKKRDPFILKDLKRASRVGFLMRRAKRKTREEKRDRMKNPAGPLKGRGIFTCILRSTKPNTQKRKGRKRHAGGKKSVPRKDLLQQTAQETDQNPGKD